MRRGLSTVFAAGIIMVLAATLFTMYMIYLDSNAYRMRELGNSLEDSIYRAGESLEAYIDGELVEVVNVGDVPIEISQLTVHRGGELSFIDVYLRLMPGERGYLNIPVGTQPLYLISNRGRIFTVGGVQDQSCPQQCLIEQYFYSFWLDNDTTIINYGESIDGSVVASSEKVENGILILSDSRGYVVLDLVYGRTLYEGMIYLIPSRDGKIIYTGELYIDGRLSGYYPYIYYVGRDYMVLGGLGKYFLASSGSGVIELPNNVSKARFLYNGNWSYYVWLVGWEGSYYRIGVMRIDPMVFNATRYDVYIPLEPFTTLGDVAYMYGGPLSTWILDNGSMPTSMFIAVNLQGMNYPLTYVFDLKTASQRVLVAEFNAIYRDSPSGLIDGITFNLVESTLQSGFPLDTVAGDKLGSDVRMYEVDFGKGVLSIHGLINIESDVMGSSFSWINMTFYYQMGSIVMGMLVNSSPPAVERLIILGLVRGGSYQELDRFTIYDDLVPFSLEVGEEGRALSFYTGDEGGDIYYLGYLGGITGFSISNGTALDTGFIRLSLSVKALVYSDGHLYPYRLLYTIVEGGNPLVWKIIPWFHYIVKVYSPDNKFIYLSLYGVAFSYTLRYRPNLYVLDLDNGSITNVKWENGYLGVYTYQDRISRRDVTTLPYADVSVVLFTNFYVVITMHPKSMKLDVYQY